MVLKVSTGYYPKYLELVRLYNTTQMNFTFQRGGTTIQMRQTEIQWIEHPTPPSSCHSSPDSNLPYIPPRPPPPRPPCIIRIRILVLIVTY